MNTVKMLKTAQGHNDTVTEHGIVTDPHARMFEEGQIYDIGDELTNTFMSMGVAELVNDTSVEGREMKVANEMETKPAKGRSKKAAE